MENSIQNSKSYIYNALLKYGHANFSLTILEYCEPEQCIEREDYYICSLPHEYNILSKAGSRLDSKCSDKTKQIMSDAHKGKTHSNDQEVHLNK
jgi:group I intron endonuclease